MYFLYPAKNLWKSILSIGLLATCSLHLAMCGSKTVEEVATPPQPAEEETLTSASLAKFRHETSALLQQGKPQEAIDRCRVLPADLAPMEGVDAVCKRLITRALQQWETQLKTLRDTGNGDRMDSATSCASLQRERAAISEESATAIADLCHELALSGQIRDVQGDLKTALESKRIEVPASCEAVLKRLESLKTTYGKSQSKRLHTECYATFPRNAVQKLTASLNVDRDAGSSADVIQRCFDLKNAAARLSTQDEKRAVDLCAAIQARGKARIAMDEAARHRKEGIHRLPRSCSLAVMALTGLTTDEARTLRGQVVNTCFADLGLAILKAKVPTMGFGCDPNVQQVVRAVQNHRLQAAELDEWMTKALPRCGPR